MLTLYRVGTPTRMPCHADDACDSVWSPQIDWIDAQQLEPESKDADQAGYDAAWALLRAAHGVLVPGTDFRHPATCTSPRSHTSRLLRLAIQRNSSSPCPRPSALLCGNTQRDCSCTNCFPWNVRRAY